MYLCLCAVYKTKPHANPQIFKRKSKKFRICAQKSADSKKVWPPKFSMWPIYNAFCTARKHLASRTHTPAHTHAHTHAQTHAHTHAHTRTNTLGHKHTPTHTRTHTHTHKHTYAYCYRTVHTTGISVLRGFQKYFWSSTTPTSPPSPHPLAHIIIDSKICFKLEMMWFRLDLPHLSYGTPVG